MKTMKKHNRKFHINDLSEIIVGSVLLAFPVAITEEVWNLGKELSGWSAIAIVIASMVFIAWFCYHAYYQSILETHWQEFLLRTTTVYTVTLVVAAVILVLFSQFPLITESAVAIKRMIIVALPASFCATVVDSIN